MRSVVARTIARTIARTVGAIVILSPVLLILALRARDWRRDDRSPQVIIERARQDLLASNALAAEERLRRLLAEEPGDAQAWQLLGESLDLQSRGNDARDAFARAADLQPGWDAPAVRLASAALAAERVDQSEFYLARAVAEGGTTRRLLRARSLLHTRRGEFDAAADDLVAASKRGGGALDLLDAARHRKTAAFIAARPSDADEVLLREALEVAQDDDLAQAIRRELTAPTSAARPAGDHVQEARRAADVALTGLASAHLREALRARPDDPDIAFALGMRWGAARDLRQTVALAAELPGGAGGIPARRLLGWYHVGCGDTDRAADYLLQHEREQSRRAAALDETLRRARAQGPDEAALVACQRIAAHPGDALPRLVLGMAAEYRGDLAEATRHYTAALARAPWLALAANDLAWCLGRSETARPVAIRLAGWARNLAPDNDRIAHTESVILRLAGSTLTERNDR